MYKYRLEMEDYDYYDEYEYATVYCDACNLHYTCMKLHRCDDETLKEMVGMKKYMIKCLEHYDLIGDSESVERVEKDIIEVSIYIEQLEYILRTGRPCLGMDWDIYEMEQLHEKCKRNLQKFLDKL